LGSRKRKAIVRESRKKECLATPHLKDCVGKAGEMQAIKKKKKKKNQERRELKNWREVHHIFEPSESDALGEKKTKKKPSGSPGRRNEPDKTQMYCQSSVRCKIRNHKRDQKKEQEN